MSRVMRRVTRPVSYKEQAYQLLKEAILNRTLVPGVCYSENQLAAELAISRTPVREALTVLATEGLVRSIPQKGVEIVDYTISDVLEIFEVREAIEGFVVERLAGMTSVDLSDLYELMTAMEEAANNGDDFVAFMENDRIFHEQLASKLENVRISQINSGLRDHVHLLGLRALESAGRTRRVFAEHRAILDAISARDPVRARAAMLDHIGKTRDAVLARLAPTANPSGEEAP